MELTSAGTSSPQSPPAFTFASVNVAFKIKKPIESTSECAGEEGYHSAIGAQGRAVQVRSGFANQSFGVSHKELKGKFRFVFVRPKLCQAAGYGIAFG
mmetsp:Transcript_21459/g.36854  ORF Transcript_21459/g.36854 Transcript_21459/m.36854 type:complete len:98 (-) Transcript_21459:390-683(-)